MLVVPEADPVVGEFRAQFYASAVARRLPAHVTLLIPFVPAEDVPEELLGELEALYASVPSFDFELARVERFDEVVWLAPEPRDRLVDLVELTYSRFPEHPPYGGLYTSPEPHLTIGAVTDGIDITALTAAAERRLAGHMPVRCSARAVSLLEAQADGTWAERTAFPLGGAR